MKAEIAVRSSSTSSFAWAPRMISSVTGSQAVMQCLPMAAGDTAAGRDLA
jgi:hypothetical protein